MFEYIGEMAKDYIYAITPLLEDALMDRDLVHRQASKICFVREILFAVFSCLWFLFCVLKKVEQDIGHDRANAQLRGLITANITILTLFQQF